MNVAYHCSDAFAPIAGASIVSLFENNRSFDDIHVYIIERQVQSANREKLKAIAREYGRELTLIPMEDINATQNLNLRSIKENWLFDSYNRLFLDRLLPPGVDRVLYLDCDVLVADDLHEIWDMDMQGYCAAAVADCFNEAYYPLFGLSPTARYCNSGVLLLDLKKWGEQGVGQRIKDYIAANDGYVFFMEQTAINAVLQDEILILPPRFNVSTMMMALSYEQLVRLRGLKRFYARDEVMRAVEKPVIAHGTGFFLAPKRYWIKDSTHPIAGMYQKYRALSPWGGGPDCPDGRGAGKKAMDALVAALPLRFVLFAGRNLYRLRCARIRREMAKHSRSGAAVHDPRAGVPGSFASGRTVKNAKLEPGEDSRAEPSEFPEKAREGRPPRVPSDRLWGRDR